MGGDSLNPAAISSKWKLSQDWQLSYSYTTVSSNGSTKVRTRSAGQVAEISYSTKYNFGDLTDVVVLKVKTGSMDDKDDAMVFQVRLLNMKELNLVAKSKDKARGVQKSQKWASLAREYSTCFDWQLFHKPTQLCISY